jgi:hypothetical protein
MRLGQPVGLGRYVLRTTVPPRASISCAPVDAELMMTSGTAGNSGYDQRSASGPGGMVKPCFEWGCVS